MFLNKIEEKPKLIWSLTLVYMLLIFVLSSIPVLPQPSDDPYIPVIEHIIEYAILSVLLFSAVSSTRKFNIKQVFLLTVVAASLYGLSDELHQFIVPGRICSLDDVLADSLGALIGSFLQAFRADSNPNFGRNRRNP